MQHPALFQNVVTATARALVGVTHDIMSRIHVPKYDLCALHELTCMPCATGAAAQRWAAA